MDGTKFGLTLGEEGDTILVRAARGVLCCDEDSLPSVSEGGVNECVSVCGENACTELTVENNPLINAHSCNKTNDFSFVNWNVNGLLAKICDSDFIASIRSFYFVCLVETFVEYFDSNIVHEYTVFCKPAVKLTTRGRRSGGVITSHHLSLSLVDRWGTKDDRATVLHSSLFSAFRRASPNFDPVHSVTLSSHLFFCLPLLLPPCTAPCRIIFASPVDLVLCPYHLSLRFFTVVRRSS